MKINTKLADGKWISWNEKVKFLIRAFPIDNLMLLNDQFVQQRVLGKQMLEYSVMDWDGIEDEDGKKYECNDANKDYILNYYDELGEFVVREIEKLKNLEPRSVKKTSKK